MGNYKTKLEPIPSAAGFFHGSSMLSLLSRVPCTISISPIVPPSSVYAQAIISRTNIPGGTIILSRPSMGLAKKVMIFYSHCKRETITWPNVSYIQWYVSVEQSISIHGDTSLLIMEHVYTNSNVRYDKCYNMTFRYVSERSIVRI
jgi:hypothetical protein